MAFFCGIRNYNAQHQKSTAYESKKFLNYISQVLTGMDTLLGTTNINDIEDVCVIARSCPIIAAKRLKATIKKNLVHMLVTRPRLEPTVFLVQISSFTATSTW